MENSGNDATAPLDEVYTQTVTVNSREYQWYSLAHDIYFSPIDEDEVDRLQIEHEALRRIFDDRLIFPPIQRLRKILDCGFGSGTWAIEVAHQHPQCKVLGVDISPHMAREDELSNLEFQVDDLNKRFTFNTGEFDLVHSQMMAGGIHSGRWKDYIKDIHRVLRPGGWCQIVELYFQAQSDNGSLTEDHGLRQWSKLFLQSAGQYKDPRAPVKMNDFLANAGFVEIESTVLQMPMCSWPLDLRMKEVGMLNRDNIQRLLESQAIYLFTEKLGIPLNQAQMLIARARAEADNPAIKAYFPLYVSIGRKRR